MDATEKKLADLKKLRKKLAAKLAESAQDAIGHFENGSFELVEQALMECQDSICELKEQIENKHSKRRTTIHAKTTEASPAS